MNPILEAESLVKRYGKITAVNDISFEIYPGEIFGFLGPNGAGKTTTIKMMTGLLEPDSGRVIIDRNMNGNSIGFCPQHIVVWENLTCLEQIVFMGRMYDMSSGEVILKGEELLESLGLSGVKNRIAKKLSGGMQRRLNIALALIHSPRILFLDEPQAGLDPQSRILVRDYIRSIKDKTTVVLTTHDMEEADKLSDRICIIDNGRLLISGTTDEVRKTGGYEDLIEIEISGDLQKKFISSLNPELVKNMSVSSDSLLFKVNDPIPALDEMLKIVRENGIKIQDLRLRKNSLEDIFINLTGRSLRE